MGSARELDLTALALEAYDCWYINLEKLVHAKRLDIYALRFMALLAANERLTVVDDETVDRVTRLMDWQLKAGGEIFWNRADKTDSLMREE